MGKIGGGGSEKAIEGFTCLPIPNNRLNHHNISRRCMQPPLVWAKNRKLRWRRPNVTMTPYQIQGPARKCAGTGRELKAGESIYSVLVDEGGLFVRRDYSVDAWSAPPEGAIACRRGHVPPEGRSQRRRSTMSCSWSALPILRRPGSLDRNSFAMW